MTDETERIILKAALKIFAQKGYKGATTTLISEEAKFSEKTLFRKFKTKKNLYNMVLLRYADKFKQDMGENVFTNKEFKSPQKFIECYIRNMAKVLMDNFEFFNLSINEPNEVLESTMEKTVDILVEYLEKNIKNPRIDYKIFALSISSFLYTISIEKFMGRTYLNYEDTLERYVKYHIQYVSII
jgi:TetR/AcrR family transcriptional regulator